MIGSNVGPYRVVGRLGVGGMGEVYLGVDTRLHRNVALKLLTSPDLDQGDGRERVLGEARAAARLNHPNIAAVYDVIEQDGRAHIVMEYVEGETLASRLDHDALPIDRVMAIGRQLASAVSAAHAAGVVHHDLKPANILLTPDGPVKVLDFGVARLTSPSALPTDTTRTVPPLLSPGDGRSGTPWYMAPERLLNQAVDKRSDIYSLGVVLFEMATGRRPFQGVDLIGLVVTMSTTPAPAADSVNPLVPRALSAVIARSLEARPERRYQSARELEAALIDAEILTDGRLFWRKAGKWAGAAVLILALGGAGMLVSRGRRESALVSERSTILAILPVDNLSGDLNAEYLGTGFVSLLSSNFASVSRLTVLSRESTAPYESARHDLSPLGRELGVDLVLDVAIKTAGPSPVLVARLRRPDAGPPVWERTLTGDALAVERRLIDEAGRAIEQVAARHLTREDWARLRTMPTTSSAALQMYSEARVLLDRFDVPGNIDRAVALLNSALASDPRFASAQAALGDAYWLKYQRDKDPALVSAATNAVLKALQIDSTQSAVYYSLGNMQYLTGRHEEATDSLKRALALQPDSDESHRLLGLVLADGGDFDAAVQEVQQAIRIRPRYWRNHSTLGYIYYRAGRYQDAVAPYQRATELQPTDASAFSSLGLVYHRLGRVDEAIGYYEHAVRLGPSVPALSNLAMAYYGAKRYREALATYQQALAADPRSIENMRNIADVYIRLQEPEQARNAYERAISMGEELLTVNARDYRTIILIAVCEARLGRTASAERHAAEARALAPTDQETLQYSAEIHARIGDTETALKDLGAAIANGYSRREARDNEELVALRHLPQFQRLVAE